MPTMISFGLSARQSRPQGYLHQFSTIHSTRLTGKSRNNGLGIFGSKLARILKNSVLW
jgi:hypothetical protein